MVELKESSDVTVVITSYNRLDLLQKTLDSFLKFNTYPVKKTIVYDDYGYFNYTHRQKLVWNLFEQKHPGVTFLYGEKRLGQIGAIDWIYKGIDTPWIFHCEDDFVFYRRGFIEESISLMQDRPKCIQVHLREQDDLNGHPLIKSPDGLLMLKPGYRSIWHGFSFNPGLKRLSDYKLIGSYGRYAKFNPKRPYESEAAIGKEYKRRGFYAGITESGYCKHIGDGFGIRN